MNKKLVVGAVAGLITTVSIVVAGRIENALNVEDGLPVFNPATEVATEPSKLAVTPAGAITYVVPINVDGGIELRQIEPDCVRKMAESADCSKKIVSMSGETIVVDPDVLNRFNLADAVGTECTPCACSVYSGENGDASEVQVNAE